MKGYACILFGFGFQFSVIALFFVEGPLITVFGIAALLQLWSYNSGLAFAKRNSVVHKIKGLNSLSPMYMRELPINLSPLYFNILTFLLGYKWLIAERADEEGGIAIFICKASHISKKPTNFAQICPNVFMALTFVENLMVEENERNE